MHGRLKLPLHLERDVLRSHELFKFWELTDNISNTVHDRDVVTTNHT